MRHMHGGAVRAPVQSRRAALQTCSRGRTRGSTHACSGEGAHIELIRCHADMLVSTRSLQVVQRHHHAQVGLNLALEQLRDEHTLSFDPVRQRVLAVVATLRAAGVGRQRVGARIMHVHACIVHMHHACVHTIQVRTPHFRSS
jgi:hypothetical protein